MPIRTSPLPSLLLFSVLLAGCTNSSSLPVSVSNENSKSVVQVSTSIAPDEITFKDPDGSFDIKNGEILVKGAKVGYVKNNIIYLQVYGKTIHFPGNYQDLSLGSADFPPFNVGGFSMNDLVFTPQYRGPYAIYRSVDPTKISYTCDRSLVFNGDGSPRPFQYCETNGKDLLSQYEFSAAGTGFSTGAGFAEVWQKVYIKRLNGDNLIFSAFLPGQVTLASDASFGEIIEAYDVLAAYKLIGSGKIPSSIRTKSSYSSDEYIKAEKDLAPLVKEIRTVIASKSFLDLLLANPDTKQQLRMWDSYMSNISDQAIL